MKDSEARLKCCKNPMMASLRGLSSYVVVSMFDSSEILHYISTTLRAS